MLIDLGLSAIQSTAKNSTANPLLTANVAKAANVAKEKQSDNRPSPEKLAGLAGLAVSNRLLTPEKAPTVAHAPDPSMAPLLALAMAYCDHIGASDKARKDWHTDIEATPAEQRGELAAYLRSQLPAPKPKAMPTVATAQPAAKPMPKFHIAQPWCALDREFQAHYWQCPECKAGGRTRGPLCPTGQQLSEALEAA